MSFREKEPPGFRGWFQELAPLGRAASAGLAAREEESVVVWKMLPTFFQVMVPPALRQTLAGTNLRELVASTVTAL